MLSAVALVAATTSVSVVAQISAAAPASAAQTTCTPDSGYAQCAEFSYSGADQTFTLPAGADASNVLVKAWGAGGGGDDYYIHNGGGGGYAQGVLNLTGNTTLTAIVGQGGDSACNKVNAVTGSLGATYGGGGPTQADPSAAGGYYCGAAGGGRSAVRVGSGVTNTSASNEVLTAGGGGGTSDGTPTVNEQAGGGGGASGVAGDCTGLDTPANCTQGAGAGGTATAGGAGGTHTGTEALPYLPPTAGVQFQGGTGACGENPSPFGECGGGGGGGYFGGGGGDFFPTRWDSPGGGGSGHLDPLVMSGAATAATTYTSAGSAQAQYVAGVGVGGGSGTVNEGASSDGVLRPGGDGLVVVEFNIRPTITISKISTSGVGTFNFTGTNGYTPQAITTVTPGAAVAAATETLTAVGASTVITEAPTIGFTLTAITCTGLGTGGTATPNLAAGTVTLNAAATASGAAIACTFTNGAPALMLAKTASPTSVSAVGTTVTYSFKITNSGTGTITNASISDTLTPPAGALLSGPTCPGGAASMAANAVVTCTATYKVTQADLDNGSIDDSARASGTNKAGTTTTSNSSAASVSVTKTTALGLTRTAMPTTITAAGQTVTYTFAVKNKGNVTVSGLAIADTQTSPAGALATGPTCPAAVAPGATVNCTATYVATQADVDNGTVKDSATASGTDPQGLVVTSAASAVTVTATRAPALTVLKTALPTSVSSVGQTVTYTFAVTNSGNVTVNTIAITDTQTAPSGALATGPTCPITTAAPGVTVWCTATYVVTLADLNNGSVNDSAKSTGKSPTGVTVTSASSPASVSVAQAPTLLVTKSATPTTVTTLGATVTYTFGVTNTGNVTVNTLAIRDTQTAPAGTLQAAPICTATTLTPGAATSCTGRYVVTQADLDNGAIVDSAIATGKSPSGTTATSNTATANVTATQTPSITLVKSATPATVTTLGSTVTYTFAVKNTGNVTIGSLAVADTQASPAGSLVAAPACLTMSLAPGVSTNCTATYQITQADLDTGSVSDTATATGKDPQGATTTSKTSSASVSVTKSTVLALTKSASPGTVAVVGQTVTYTFVATNSSNVTLSGVGVADVQTAPAGSLQATPQCTALTSPATSCSGTAVTLLPGQSATFTGTYVTTQADLDQGSVKDTATASGKDPQKLTVTSSRASATVAVTKTATLTLTKSAAPATVTSVGATVTYTFAVTNSGNVTVNTLAIRDTQTAPAGALLAGPTCVATTLAPATSTTCTATYKVTQADLDNGSVNDTATAAGTDPQGTTVTSLTSSAAVTATQSGALTLSKTPTPSTVSAVGQTVTYSFHITNSGNVTVNTIVINDAQGSPAGPLTTGPTCLVTTLAPSASTDCTATYVTTQADLDAGTIKDTATVVGADPANNPVTSPIASASVGVTQTPKLTLLKAASPATVAAVGDVITYTFHATNSGNVTITNLAVADTQASPAGLLATGPTCPVTALAPGASTDCTATYVVAQPDLNNGTVDDSATVGGTDPGNIPVVSAASAASVSIDQTPKLTLTKTPSTSTVAAVGDVITYTFAVTNTGNVQVTALVINDSQISPAGALDAAPVCLAAVLAPNASTTCTATYTVSQAALDRGAIADSATAVALDPNGKAVTSNTATASVTAIQTSALALTKTPSVSTVSAVGDRITYTFGVTNDGNVTVSNVAITDAQVSPAGGLDAAPTCLATTLAPLAATTCTATYAVTQNDLNNGSVKDTAKATATDPMNALVTSPAATATVTVNQQPKLTLVKSASPASVAAIGDTVTYTFSVTNSGNVTVSNIAIADTQTPPAGALTAAPICLATNLQPGSSTTCSATYVVVQADLDNGTVGDTATAGGVDPNNNPVTSNSSTASVPVVTSAALTLVKTPSVSTVAAIGDVITYTFSVINSGNVTVHGLTVSDAFTAPALDSGLSPITCLSTTLAPAASTTCTATYVATQADVDNGSITNTGAAHATDPNNAAVTSNDSTARVGVKQTPTLTLVKTASPTSITGAGQTVTYSFAVTNTGNVTVGALAINDTLAVPALDSGLSAITCPSTTLAPAASTTCTATYVATQADVDNGKIHNSATVTGTDPNSGVITSNPSTTDVTIASNPALTVAKTSTTTAVSVLGFVITYHFQVVNTGNVTLSAVGVSDAQLSPSVALTTAPACQSLTTPAGTCAGATATLLPTQAATFTATYTVTQPDLDNGSISDSASASGTPPNGAPVTSVASTLKIPTLQFPGISVVKSTTTTSVSAVGDVVTYTFLARNTGNVTLSGVGIADSQTLPSLALTTSPACQSLANPAAACSGSSATLAPNQSASFTATYTVTQADLNNGSVTDAATASGTPPQIPGGVTPIRISSTRSTATVAVNQTPKLMVVKTSTTASVKAVGDVITYQFVATNTGNVDLTGVGIGDAQTLPAGALTTTPICQSLAPTGTCSGATATLVPGQSATYTATYVVTQADLDNGSVKDAATASGTPHQTTGGPLPAPITSDPATVSVPVAQSPTLTLVTSASPATVTAAGATVTYSFAVTNTGNVTINNLSVSDAMASPALDSGLSAIPCLTTTLAPAAGTICTATYVVTLADANNGIVATTAAASGTPPQIPGGPPPTAVTSLTSSATVTVTQSPSLTVVKSASVTSFNAAGQPIIYSFGVTNTGNVTVNSVSINDSPTAPANNANLSAITCPATSLNPSASMTCSATYTTGQVDVDNGSVGNSATASGTPPQVPGGPTPKVVTSSPSTATVTAAKDPAIALVKTATTIDTNGDGVIGVGDQITYSFTVTNTGNTTLLGPSVSDATLGAVTCPTTTMAPGVSVMCTGNVKHTITQVDVDAGKVDGIATATTSPSNCLQAICPVVTSNQSSADVPLVQTPSIGLVTAGTYLAGVTNWTITVINRGNVTLVNLVVTDPKAGTVTCPSNTMAPGTSQVCTTPTYIPSAAEVAAGKVSNTATAVADGVGPTLISQTASATAEVVVPTGLAFTGSPIQQLLGIALALMIAGLGVLVLGSRRRRA